MLFNLSGEFYAITDKCPHQGGSLSKGRLTGLVWSRRSPASTATRARAK